MGNIKEKSIKIIVCDDMDYIRNSICDKINKIDGFEVVGTASSAKEAKELLKTQMCDVILVDIQMEYEQSGLDLIKYITKNYPAIKSIVLTIHDDDELIFEAYVNGAVDFLIKDSDENKLISTMKKVVKENDYIGTKIMKCARNNADVFRRSKESMMFFIYGFSTLTAGERAVLRLIYEGYSRSGIAKKECISLSTVSKHINHILRKLNYSSTKEIVAFLKDLDFYEIMNIKE